MTISEILGWFVGAPTKEQARIALDRARDERDAALERLKVTRTGADIAAAKEAEKKYIAARDYYTSKWPRFV